MMPLALEESGLIIALEEMFSNSLHFSSISYEYQLLGITKTDRFDPQIEVTIYRVAQELTHNIIKHSRAKNVIAQLRKTKSHIIFHLEDDGVGGSISRGYGQVKVSLKPPIYKRIDKKGPYSGYTTDLLFGGLATGGTDPLSDPGLFVKRFLAGVLGKRFVSSPLGKTMANSTGKQLESALSKPEVVQVIKNALNSLSAD